MTPTPHRGFTLIEVLVAMTILTMAFAVLFSLSSRSLDGMLRAENTERRVAFARNKLDQLELISDLEAGDRASGTLADGTQWTVVVAPFITAVSESRDGVPPNPEAMVQVRLEMAWPGRSEPQSWAVNTYRLVRPRPQAVSHVPLERQLNALAEK